MKRTYLQIALLCTTHCTFAMEQQSTELKLPQHREEFLLFQTIANGPSSTLSPEEISRLQKIARKNPTSPNNLKSQILVCQALLTFSNPENRQDLQQKITSAEAELTKKFHDKSKEEKLETTFFTMFPEETVSMSEDHGQGDRNSYKKWKETRARKMKLEPFIQQLTQTTQTLEQSARQLDKTIEESARQFHKTIEEKTAELAKLQEEKSAKLAKLRNELKLTTNDYRKTAEDLCAAALSKKILECQGSNFTTDLKQQYVTIQKRWDQLTFLKAFMETELTQNILLPDDKNAKQTQLVNVTTQIADTTKKLHSAARDYKIATSTYSSMDATWWKTRGMVMLPDFSKDPQTGSPAQLVASGN